MKAKISCPARFTLEDMHADLAKKMAKLAVVLPEEADRLRRLVDKLANRIATLPAIAPCVVHGDFHIRQLMARGLNVALFDFDELGWGDPVEDFGNFIADLHGDGFEESFVASGAKTLLDGYRREGGSEVPPERLCWHTAVQLLSRAYRALLQLKPDFDVRVQRHIRLAEDLV